MKNELYSLSTLFSSKIFRIPDYQRGYAWEMKQIEDFWGDLLNSIPDQNHYAGVITLEAVPAAIFSDWENDSWLINGKNYEPFYVVDGQQRLTTTMILLQEIINALKAGEEINFTTSDEIIREFIYKTKGKTSLQKTYLFSYEKGNPSFEYLKSVVFGDTLDEYVTIEETSYTRNLLACKEFFKRVLSDIDLESLGYIYKVLVHGLKFNVYAISEDIDVFVAFESMNNRGKPLSHLELLKNRLIYLTTKIKSEDNERKKLRFNVNECWKAIYRYLGKNYKKVLSDDEFLFYHFYLYFNEVTGEKYNKYGQSYIIDRFYKEYLLDMIFTEVNMSAKDSEENGALQYINSYVKSLKDSVEVWYYIRNPSMSPFTSQEKELLIKLERYFKSKFSTAYRTPEFLVLAVFIKEKDSQLRADFLEKLERYLFVASLVSSERAMQISKGAFDEVAGDLFNDKLSINEII